MKRKMPDYSEMVLVKVLIPDDYEAPSEFYDCHGHTFICVGIRFEPNGEDYPNATWDVWVSPTLEDLHDKDILAWQYLPKDITENMR
jgi:hypothetical protein